MKGGRRQRRQKKRWEDNIREYIGLEFSQVTEGRGEQGKMEEIGCEIIGGAPTTLAVKGQMVLMMMMMMMFGYHSTFEAAFIFIDLSDFSAIGFMFKASFGDGK